MEETSQTWEHSASMALFPKGPFSENKKGTSLFKPKSWGHLPPVPPLVPTSVVAQAKFYPIRYQISVF